MALKKKHLQILNLLRRNKLSVNEIAVKVGYNPATIYDLMSGDTSNSNVAAEFQAEYLKVTKVIEERTHKKLSEAKEMAIAKLKSWVQAQKDPNNLPRQRHKMMVDTLNALTRATPSTSIESYEWSVLQGEELINEFQRIHSVAGTTVKRRAVQEPPTGGTGQVPGHSNEADSQGEGVQDTEIPAEPETKDVPPKQGGHSRYFRRQSFRKNYGRRY